MTSGTVRNVLVPLGRPEDQRLELKSRDALEQPEKIAREVVAMLNAGGGEVWVGLREEGGAAMEIEPIPDVERAKERLLDRLVDTLSPSPRGEEVRVEAVGAPGAETGEGLLRVIASPREERKPYALVRGARWEFYTRVGARLRPMEREELFRDQAERKDEIREAEEQINKEKEERRLSGEPLLWLRVQPAPGIDLDLQDDIFRLLADDPRASNNRSAGWGFARSQSRPRLTGSRISWGVDGEYRIHVEFRSNGGCVMEAGLAALSWKQEDLWPFALLEYPISGLRIAQTVLAGVQGKAPRHVVADLALFAVGDRALRKGSPMELAFRAHPGQNLREGDDVMTERPLVFTAEEFLKETDYCGFRLLRRVYQAFGLREKDIPREFDRRTGRLVLPE